jgi:hypothetical protein
MSQFSITALMVQVEDAPGPDFPAPLLANFRFADYPGMFGKATPICVICH